MEGSWLLIIYVIVLAVQIVLIVCSCRRKIKWIWPLLFEAISIIGALATLRYFDSLPGYGIMPGLSYFGEVVWSFLAAVGYGIVLLITLIIYAAFHDKEVR